MVNPSNHGTAPPGPSVPILRDVNQERTASNSRDYDDKSRAAEQRRLEIDAPTGALEHQANQREPNSASASHRVCALADREDPLAVGSCGPRTVVVDRDAHETPVDQLDADEDDAAFSQRLSIPSLRYDKRFRWGFDARVRT
jgi:hypothetical protein